MDCIVALPGQLFYSTGIPVSLWFLARDKANSGFRDRRGETLFIDARNMGTMISRTQRELTDEDMATRSPAPITHGAMRPRCRRVRGRAGILCKSATQQQIANEAGYVLTPGRYVEHALDAADDGVSSAKKFDALRLINCKPIRGRTGARRTN